MIYSNDDPMAILAMEISRTDNYGEYDSYDGETVCPVCGAFEPEHYYINDEEIRRLVDFIISPELLRIGDKYLLLELHAELIRKDWFMTLLDVKDYIQKKEQAYADYEDRMAWAKKMVVNIAKAGYFSSDRTIAEYNRDIWHL